MSITLRRQLDADEKAQINKLLAEMLSFYLQTGSSTQPVSLDNR